jgi:hypothetical protein
MAFVERILFLCGWNGIVDKNVAEPCITGMVFDISMHFASGIHYYSMCF